MNKHNLSKVLFIGSVLIAAIAFNAYGQKDPVSLQSVYKDYFYIGAAVSSYQIVGKDSASLYLLFKHFNSVTTENAMKWERIHPKPGVYVFDTADRFVTMGEKKNMFIVGHCLLWHQQTPAWVFTDSLGKMLTRDALLERLKDHITTIVTRYKGRIHGYDVVNEALNEDGTMRNTKWYQIIGEDYIEKAFEFAKAADPNTELYYNDFNNENPAKRAGTIKIIKNLQAKGIKIDGVGIQGHWHLDAPKLEYIDSSMTQFGRLGIKVHITEMDVNVLPRPDNYSGAEITDKFAFQAKMNPYVKGLPDSLLLKQADRYEDFFKIFIKHRGTLKRVTLWGIADNMSWLNNWPIPGRTNYPLLFDRKYEAKPAVAKLLKLVK